MFTFQELSERFNKLTGVTSTSDIQFGKDLVNEAQKYISNLRNWEWTEVTRAYTTTANQSEFKLPANYRKLISFKVTVAGIDYIPQQVTDPVTFDRIRSYDFNTSSDYPTYFHIRGNRLLVYPQIVSAGNEAEMLYQLRPIDMLDDDKVNGTVTATNGSTTVTGSTTSFTNTRDVGKHLQITADNGDRQWYEVASVTSATELELDIPYEGETVAGVAYRISELPVVPEDFQEIIWMWALSRWHVLKGNEGTVQVYIAEAERLLNEMERRYSKKVYNNVSNIFGELSSVNPNYDSGAITIT